MTPFIICRTNKNIFYIHKDFDGFFCFSFFEQGAIKTHKIVMTLYPYPLFTLNPSKQ